MLLALFGFLAVLNVVASGIENDALELATKPFLMPVLALWAWRNGRNRLLVAGLLLSAGGDIALLKGDEAAWFIAGMVLFLGAHLCYITMFAKAGARPKAVAMLAYGVVFAAALVWLWKPLGGLAIPMTFYGLALAAMATLASNLGWRIGLGGGLFPALRSADRDQGRRSGHPARTADLGHAHLPRRAVANRDGHGSVSRSASRHPVAHVGTYSLSQ